MLTLFTESDRYNFESAVPTQDIRSHVHYLHNRLHPMTGRTMFTVRAFSTEVDPTPMGPNQAYRLPHSLIDVSIDYPYQVTPIIKIMETAQGFQIAIELNHGVLARTYSLLDFDEYMNLTHFSLRYEPYSIPSARADVMQIVYDQLPSLLGYIVCCNSRDRSLFTLGEPQQYESRGSNADPTQYLGPVRDITNPRDNPTGIGKRPHERSGHYRQNADGTRSWVSPTVVHKDDFEGEDRPKKPKF